MCYSLGYSWFCWKLIQHDRKFWLQIFSVSDQREIRLLRIKINVRFNDKFSNVWLAKGLFLINESFCLEWGLQVYASLELSKHENSPICDTFCAIFGLLSLTNFCWVWYRLSTVSAVWVSILVHQTFSFDCLNHEFLGCKFCNFIIFTSMVSIFVRHPMICLFLISRAYNQVLLY